MQEETIAHGDQGQGHGCMAAKAKGKSGGKLNEQKREKMEGSTVAPNKNGGWDREFVYECDDDRVPSNFEFRPLFDLFVFDQVYATLTFFFSVVPLFFRIFFFPDFAGIATAVPFPLIDAERRCYQVRDRDRQSWFIFREHICEFEI